MLDTSHNNVNFCKSVLLSFIIGICKEINGPATLLDVFYNNKDDDDDNNNNDNNKFSDFKLLYFLMKGTEKYFITYLQMLKDQNYFLLYIC